MNRMSWMGLTVLLAGGAVFSTSAMRRLSQPLPPFTSRYAAAEGSVKAVRPSADEARAAAKPAATDAELILDDLWEKSLFHHERTEKNAGAGPPTTPEEAQAQTEFELVGIARIGRPEEAQAVAIIKQEQSVSRASRLAAARARTIRGRGGRVAPTPPPPEPEETSKKPLKKMFRVGDAVNETGYVVKSIDPGANTVILSKGSEEITLKIELSAKKKSTRRQEVVNQELSVREKYKVAPIPAPADAAAAAAGGAAPAAETPPPAATVPADAGGPAGVPPPPPGGFISRSVRTNPGAPGNRPPAVATPAEAGAAGDGAAPPAVNNPILNRIRQSNLPGRGRPQPQPQPQP
ncbi:MAG TPA: hypothetical protein PKY10_01785 [Lentisphaeria bacterium]|nr:hypothetical protein [Lentisphaeria bacterium]